MSFTFAGKQVYLATYVKERDPAFFYGGGPSIRGALLKKGVPETEIYYGIQTKDGWNVSSATIRRAVALVSKEWIDANVSAFITKPIVKEVAPGVTIVKRRKKSPKPDSDVTIVKRRKVIVKYKNAPPILQLDDDEKFKNSSGEIQEIEVRGERDVDKCYFRASDVGNMLDMVDIKNTVFSKDTSFEKEFDHVTFISKGNSVSNRISPVLFLTYFGLIKLLFVSKMPIARLFQKWAINVLFCKHFDCKIIDKMDHKVQSLFEYWKYVVSTPSYVYLIKLGKLGKLRKSLHIDTNKTLSDEYLVVKYGKTTRLSERLKEHDDNYGRFKAVCLSIIFETRVDVRYLSKIESELREYLKNNEYLVENNDKYNELAIIPLDALELIRNDFFVIKENEYAMHLNDAITNLAYHS